MIMTKKNRVVEKNDLISPEVYAKKRKQFENEVVKRLTELNINFDYNVLKPYLDLLQNNIELKKMFEMRLIECSKDPYSFWDNLSGSISFQSLNECNLCHNDCVLYLNDSYKSFLMTDTSGIDVTNKLKVLVLSKSMFLPKIAMRSIPLS